MTSSVPLILSADPVPRIGARPQRARRPHVVVAYATRDGDVDLLEGGKPMRWRDSMFSHYVMRYEVDLADHQRTVELRNSPPPSAGGIYSFQATLDVGFRVYNPVAVIRRHVADALPLLYAHLIHTCHQITGRYEIEQAGMAQQALNDYFLRPEVIEDCLLLYKCRARLAPDVAWYRHQRDREEARQTVDDRAAEHKLATVEATQQIDLDLIRQQGRLIMSQNERGALSGRPLDARELIAISLERNPENVDGAIDRMLQLEALQATREEANQNRIDSRLKFMAEQNLVTKPDAAALVNRDMGQLVGGDTAPPPMTSSWDDPLPGVGRQRPNALIPVYMVIDQSAALGGYTRHLDAGVQVLLDALAAAPEIADAVRLSVLSYADSVAVPLAMGTVRAGLRLPPLTAHGAARYAVAFERLLDCVPRDVENLKAQAPAVWRPQVVFFSGAQPADGPAWTAPHRQLVDRTTHRSAPDIVACGVGQASPAAIAGIATRPELAFMAADGDTAAAIERFCAFVRQHVLGYGRALLDGEMGPLVTAPEGFRLAKELS